MGTLRVYPVALAGGELLFEVWIGSFCCGIFLIRIAYKVAVWWPEYTAGLTV
jgi:hypothetical protein